MSNKKDAKTLTMIKEGNLYKPLYITMDDRKQAIFESNNNFPLRGNGWYNYVLV